MANKLTADELMASGSTTRTISIPPALLGHEPGRNGDAAVGGEVVMRPLLMRDVDRVVRAARDQNVLTSVLMVQQSLVTPALTVEQVGNLPAGLVQYLSDRVNALSGLALGEDDLEEAVRAPLTRACFILAREFGWTPSDCSDLTVGQVLLYLEMLARDERTVAESA